MIRQSERTLELPTDLVAKNNSVALPTARDDGKPVSDSPSTLRAPLPQNGPTFTDDPLVPGVTVIKAVHITELRDAINQARARAGLPAASWAESITASVTIIKASQIVEMRTRLGEARVALGLSPFNYTDPNLSAGYTVKAAHVQELRTSVRGALGSLPIATDGLSSLSYDTASNRITTAGFSYDAAGNQVRALASGGGSQRFRYDAANRMVQVRADDNTTVIASYTHGDSNERLIADENGYRTYFDCEGGATIAEYIENGGSTTPAWSKSYVYLGGRLLSTLTPNGSGSEATEFHHPDRLGTRLVTDPSNGTSFEQVTLPFGTPLNAESTGATNRRFTSYDRSVTTGLDYANNRHYDSQQGRFTQVDSAGMNATTLNDPQSLNLYLYCVNDPINQLDPSGLGFFSFLKKAFKWIGIAVSIALIALGTMGLLIAPAMEIFFGALGATGVGSTITAASIGMLITGGLGVLSQIGPKPVRIIAGLASMAWGLYGAIQAFRSSGFFGIFGFQDPADVIKIFTNAPKIRPLNWMDEMRIWLGIIAVTPIPTPVHASSSQVDAFRAAFEDAKNRIVNNSKCAKLFGGRLAAIKALYNTRYGFGSIPGGAPTVDPSGVPSVFGAATLSTGSVVINSQGPFINQSLYVAQKGRFVTFDFGTSLRGLPFRSLILLHELGHVRKIFGPDAGKMSVNQAHTQQVKDACF